VSTPFPLVAIERTAAAWSAFSAGCERAQRAGDDVIGRDGGPAPAATVRAVEDRTLASHEILCRETRDACLGRRQRADGWVLQVPIGRALQRAQPDAVGELAGELGNHVPARERVVRCGQAVRTGQPGCDRLKGRAYRVGGSAGPELGEVPRAEPVLG
jgi:hypothetical protein